MLVINFVDKKASNLIKCYIQLCQ